jgi:hypothetical protein
MSIALPMPDRFVAQTILKAICLVLAKAGNKIAINGSNPSTGVTIPAMAKPLPVILPPLFSIITRLIIPKIRAGIAVMPKVKKLRIPRTSAAMASPLVLTLRAGACAGVLVKTELQDWHNWALSGFSVPHFVQYIYILLSI